MNLEDSVMKESEKIEPPKNQNLLKRFYNWSSRYVNYKVGSAAGVVSGGVVYYINRNYGPLTAAEAGGKQFLYNVFLAGLNTKVCERLAKTEKIKSKALSLAAATIIPTIMSFSETYLIHLLGQTPKPFESSIWQQYINLPFHFGLGLWYLRGLGKK